MLGEDKRKPYIQRNQTIKNPTHGKRSRGRPCETFMQKVYRDTKLGKEKLTKTM